MTDYYVNSARADDTGDGLTWAAAKKTFGAAVTAASTAGDRIFVVNTHNETIGADTTYTFAGTSAAPIIVICTADTSNAPPQTKTTGALIDGSGTAAVDITFAGAVYMYGMSFKAGGSTSTGSFILASTDDDTTICESCAFTIPNTSANSIFEVGNALNAGNDIVILRNSTITFGNNAGQKISLASAKFEMYGGSIAKTTTASTNVFSNTANRGGFVKLEGVDLSDQTGNLVNGTSAYYTQFYFVNCKISDSATPLGSSGGGGHTELWMYNCASGDTTHYNFAHYNYYGNTTVVATPYWTTGGALYDGTNPVTWKVTGTNASEATPYYSPWIDKYQAAATISPYLEVLRNNDSTSAFKDDQVWAEFSIQGTSGFTQAEFHDDRSTGWWYTNADQANGAGLGSWSGESGDCWSGKLGVSGITVDEIGHIRARVGVSGAYTVYVDPTIRA